MRGHRPAGGDRAAPARTRDRTRPGARAAEAAADDARAGDDRITVAAADRGGGADPREHVDIGAGHGEIDGDELALFDDELLSGMEIEDGGARRAPRSVSMRRAGAASASPIHSRSIDVGRRALSASAMARAWAVTMIPASEAASAAAPLSRPNAATPATASAANDEAKSASGCGSTASRGVVAARPRSIPTPTNARTMRATMTSRASPASARQTAREPATTAITKRRAPTSRGSPGS